jgi:hypothetical protein
MWDEDAEPGFVPPKSVRGYLARYTNGMREAVEAASGRLRLDLSDGDLDDLAQNIIVMSLEFAVNGLEDIVEMCAFHPAARPESAGRRIFMTTRGSV